MKNWDISNLMIVPHFVDNIVDRGWHVWWAECGVPLSYHRAHLNPMIESHTIPIGFVAHRGQGKAESLMASARTAAASLGIDKIYLCAEARISPYYLARGWRQFEMDVDELTVFEMQTSSPR